MFNIAESFRHGDGMVAVYARYHPSFILFNHFDKHHNWIGFLFLAFNSLHFTGYEDILVDNSSRSLKYVTFKLQYAPFILLFTFYLHHYSRANDMCVCIHILLNNLMSTNDLSQNNMAEMRANIHAIKIMNNRSPCPHFSQEYYINSFDLT